MVIAGAAAMLAVVTVAGALAYLRVAENRLEGVGLELVAEGLERPLALAFTGRPGQLFVGQQYGMVRRVEDGVLQPDPVLDLTAHVEAAGEKGFLGLALHPQFAENGLLYVAYSSVDDATVLAEYHAPDGVHADPGTARELLRLPQESDFHKGGSLVFGPDGLLYVSIGDDAWPRANTPDFNDNFRGSIIRIDVNGQTGDRPYAIPEGNAFSEAGGPPEIWDYGFRNPWRMSIDAETGDLYVGDVGAERYDEIDRHPGGEAAGLDFGWGAWEGFECRRHRIRDVLTCDDWADAEVPVAVLEGSEFASGDCAIIGGFAYRGDEVPAFEDRYVFGDFCSGRLWVIPVGEQAPQPRLLLDTELFMSTFGMDPEGELYVADVRGGTIHRLIAAELPAPSSAP